MDIPLGKVPEGIVLSPFSMKVFGLIGKYSVFPWLILKAQCEDLNLDPTQITPQNLVQLRPRLVAALTRFTSPMKGESFDLELGQMIPAD